LKARIGIAHTKVSPTPKKNEMQIEPINLRARIERVRLCFDTRVAEALVERPDLSQAEIRKQFGISQNVIRRVIKQFNLSARKRGPKHGPKPANPVLNV
jgi:predicted DNA-binding protein (UPF0251 family)